MQKSITLSAPSRLHFGLFSVGHHVDLEFGGIGLMIDSPRTVIRVGHAAELSIRGPEQVACLQTLERWLSNLKPEFESQAGFFQTPKSAKLLPLAIEIESLPPRHCGLGTGTQLALCAVAAVTQFLGLPLPGHVELAAAIGRGQRSAIGSYGFFQGGFLVDRGKAKLDTLAPLDFRTDFPEPWSVLIVRQRNASGVFGSDEKMAFDRLPATTQAERQQMIDLVRHQIIPGIMNQDYAKFGEAIFQFGRNSGLYFQTVQGGPYNGTIVQDLVTSIREFGIPAVGQTSWGPSVFAIARDDDDANDMCEKVQRRFGDQFEITITKADNRGAIQIPTNERQVTSDN